MSLNFFFCVYTIKMLGITIGNYQKCDFETTIDLLTQIIVDIFGLTET